jgi:hypothetical protein
MPSIDELMVELDMFERAEKEKETKKSTDTHSKPLVATATSYTDVISMEEIEEAMIMQKEYELDENEHQIRQNMLNERVLNLDHILKQKENLIFKIKQSDEKLLLAKNQVL